MDGDNDRENYDVILLVVVHWFAIIIAVEKFKID